MAGITISRTVIDNAAGGRNGDRMTFTATSPGATVAWNLGDGTTATTTGTHSITHTYLNQSTSPGSQVTVSAETDSVENIYENTGSGSFNTTSGVEYLVIAVGGGGTGGGGQGSNKGTPGGSGGGGGGAVVAKFTGDGTSISWTVGRGGRKYYLSDGTTTINSDGVDGNGVNGSGEAGLATTVTLPNGTITAGGGGGGVNGFSAAGGAGGTGTATIPSTDYVGYSGSSGGDSGETHAGGDGGTLTADVKGTPGTGGVGQGNFYDRPGGGGGVAGFSHAWSNADVDLTIQSLGTGGNGGTGNSLPVDANGDPVLGGSYGHDGVGFGAGGGGTAGNSHAYTAFYSGGGGDGGVVIILTTQATGSISFDFNYITMIRPDQNEVVTVIPYNAEALTAVNQQLNSSRPLSWYLTSRDNGFGSAAVIGTGYVPSISQYANGSTKLSIADGAYDVMVKDTGANIWAQHQIQIGASPTVVITNVVDDDVITSDKQVQGEATNATGGSINSSIVWDLYRMDTSTSIQTATGETFTPIPNVIGAKYDIRAKITSNSQTVTTWKRRIQINAAVVPNADIDTDTLILLPTEKNTGRVLYGGSWNSLFDDAGSGKRRAYRSAVGGGIITGSNEVRLGLAEQSSSSSIYNSNVKNIDSVKKVYDYYRDYIYSHAGDGQTWDGTTIPDHMKRHSSQTAKSFSMAECVKATLASFYVKVKNDTSGTLYSTDGNGTVQVVVNMGTGAFDVTINGNKKTGVTNNSGHSVGGIEGGSAIQCAVVAKYSSTEVTKSTFKVTVGRSNGSWSCVYKGTTFSGSNNIPMFFYSGSEPPGNNENANYGSPV